MNAVRAWKKLTAHLSEDFLGGPRLLKLAWVINLQKGGTLFFVLALMFFFDNFSTTAWVYLGLHGSYGLIWLLKHIVTPDPGWEKKVTFGGALMAFALVLGPYWLAPALLVSRRVEASPLVLGASVLLYAVGVTLMMVADGQKYFTLKVKRGLITDGMFKHVRHPNYTGEMMLYGSFALLAGHWAPWLVLACVWLGAFVPNMLMKEASMSRYPEWAAYKARTGMLLPWPFGAPSAVTAPSPGQSTAGAPSPR